MPIIFTYCCFTYTSSLHTFFVGFSTAVPSSYKLQHTLHKQTHVVSTSMPSTASSMQPAPHSVWQYLPCFDPASGGWDWGTGFSSHTQWPSSVHTTRTTSCMLKCVLRICRPVVTLREKNCAMLSGRTLGKRCEEPRGSCLSGLCCYTCISTLRCVCRKSLIWTMSMADRVSQRASRLAICTATQGFTIGGERRSVGFGIWCNKSWVVKALLRFF